jgi:hypothetical protein
MWEEELLREENDTDEFNEVDASGTDTIDPSVCTTMQERATEIMRFFDKVGSHIKWFGIYSDPFMISAEPDSNGHKWPHYFYVRGRSLDSMGREQVTAIPILFGDLPEDSVFNRAYFD